MTTLSSEGALPSRFHDGRWDDIIRLVNSPNTLVQTAIGELLCWSADVSLSTQGPESEEEVRPAVADLLRMLTLLHNAPVQLRGEIPGICAHLLVARRWTPHATRRALTGAETTAILAQARRAAEEGVAWEATLDLLLDYLDVALPAPLAVVTLPYLWPMLRALDGTYVGESACELVADLVCKGVLPRTTAGVQPMLEAGARSPIAEIATACRVALGDEHEGRTAGVSP